MARYDVTFSSSGFSASAVDQSVSDYMDSGWLLGWKNTGDAPYTVTFLVNDTIAPSDWTDLLDNLVYVLDSSTYVSISTAGNTEITVGDEVTLTITHASYTHGDGTAVVQVGDTGQTLSITLSTETAKTFTFKPLVAGTYELLLTSAPNIIDPDAKSVTFIVRDPAIFVSTGYVEEPDPDYDNVTLSTNLTTTNTLAWTAVSGASLTVTNVKKPILAHFHGVVGMSAASVIVGFNLYVDSVLITDSTNGVFHAAAGNTSDRIPVSFDAMLHLDPGSHTITLSWKLSASATATLYGANSPIEFFAYEL